MCVCVCVCVQAKGLSLGMWFHSVGALVLCLSVGQTNATQHRGPVLLGWGLACSCPLKGLVLLCAVQLSQVRGQCGLDSTGYGLDSGPLCSLNH